MQPSTTPTKKPVVSWYVTGVSLIVVGAVLIPTMFLTAIGVGLILGGVAVTASAYLRDHYRDK